MKVVAIYPNHLRNASCIFRHYSAIIGPVETLKESECRSACPVANALDVVGDRWTLLVIRDLMFMNKHEYHEFVNGPEGIATNILSDRLKRLVCTGLIDSFAHPDHKSKKLYYLTPKGKDLLPLMVEMILWGGTYRASPDMPKAHFNKIKRNPEKFIRNTIQELQGWEKKHIQKEQLKEGRGGGRKRKEK